MTSRWAYGRLIRHEDGSFQSKAHRIGAEEVLLDTAGAAVTGQDLDALVAAVGRPQPGHAIRRES